MAKKSKKRRIHFFDKKMFIIIGVLLAVSVVCAGYAIAKNSNTFSKDSCATIQSGTLYGSDGSLLEPGYNEWGYNYQANMFNGSWCDYHPVYKPGGAQHEWCVENYGDVKLMMKWNNAWLSNKDCDGDSLLDRYYGYPSYIGSGAWLTNHEFMDYEKDGKKCNTEYFVKIVAVPIGSYLMDGVWYGEDGAVIGKTIWGQFAIIQEKWKDSCDPEGSFNMHEKLPKLGNWKSPLE